MLRKSIANWVLRRGVPAGPVKKPPRQGREASGRSQARQRQSLSLSVESSAEPERPERSSRLMSRMFFCKVMAA